MRRTDEERIYPPLKQQGTPPHWLPYVMVDDCDRMAQKAVELGARTLVPRTDIDAVGRFSVFSDPTGAALPSSSSPGTFEAASLEYGIGEKLGPDD